MAPAIASAVHAARHLNHGAIGVPRTNADGGRLFIINPRDNELRMDDHDELIVLDYPRRERVNPWEGFLGRDQRLLLGRADR
jgi:hypothetical protein